LLLMAIGIPLAIFAFIEFMRFLHFSWGYNWKHCCFASFARQFHFGKRTKSFPLFAARFNFDYD
jgi:hypothetical protein